MKKKLIGSVIAIAAMATLLAACGTKEKNIAPPKTAGVTIKLGVMPSTDNLPLLVAAKEGLDKKNNVKIEIEPFKAAKDRDAAFAAGKVDGVISDVIALAIYEQGGLDVKVTSTTHDRFDIVALDKAMTDIKDLKGKSLIIAKNGGIEYSADKMLEAAGMEPSDVKKIDIPPVPTRLELLTAKKADAAVLPEPFITISANKGVHVIDSTTKIGLNPFIIGFPAKTIEAKKGAIQGMYKAYDAAVAEINSNLDNQAKVSEYRDLLIKNVGFPAALKAKITIEKFPKATQIDVKDINDAFQWAGEHNLLRKNLAGKDVLSDVYFK